MFGWFWLRVDVNLLLKADKLLLSEEKQFGLQHLKRKKLMKLFLRSLRFVEWLYFLLPKQASIPPFSCFTYVIVNIFAIQPKIKTLIIFLDSVWLRWIIKHLTHAVNGVYLYFFPHAIQWSIFAISASNLRLSILIFVNKYTKLLQNSKFCRMILSTFKMVNARSFFMPKTRFFDCSFPSRFWIKNFDHFHYLLC